MATSGVYGSFVYRVNQLIEDAAYDAGIAASLLTAELLMRGMRELNLMFAAMPNLRIYTWQQQRILIPLYEATIEATAPAGTFNLLDRQFRTPTRLSGTLASSAGGDIDAAVDDDFATIFTQSTPNGSLQITLSSAAQLCEVGILWGSAATVTTVYVDRSDDGISWLQVGQEDVTPENYKWWWYAVDGAISSSYWRLRVAGTLSAREVYFGGTYTDVTLAQLNRNQYMQLPNKMQLGRPLQAWLDRQRDQTILRLWQVPSRQFRYCHIAAIQQRMIADVTSLRQEIDVPARWYSAVRANLALRMCRSFVEADRKRMPDLQSQVMETQLPAISEDRDGAPITTFPDISAYT